MPRDTFLDFVLDQLEPLRDVHPKKMFGGVGLYRDSVFFGIVAAGRLYFKTDDRTRGDYLAENMEPFAPTAKITLTSYYEVPPGVLDNRQHLADWAWKAIQVQQRAQTNAQKPVRSKPKAKPKRKGTSKQ